MPEPSERLISELCATPLTIPEAMRPPTAGGLPNAPGLYCWWTTEEDAVPSVPAQRVSGRSEFVLYVGISPKRSSSKGTLRKRVSTHVGGNIGSSTFRFALASLLWEEQGWQPELPSDRALLVPKDNVALSSWQVQHLRISWAVQPEPWTVEDEVIERLQPPMNRASNSAHPFYEQMGSARTRLRGEASRFSGITI